MRRQDDSRQTEYMKTGRKNTGPGGRPRRIKVKAAAVLAVGIILNGMLFTDQLTAADSTQQSVQAAQETIPPEDGGGGQDSGAALPSETQPQSPSSDSQSNNQSETPQVPPQSESQSEAQSEHQSEPQSEAQSEHQSESQSEAQSEHQSESQSEAQSEHQSESQSETQSEHQSESQSESQSETQSETQSESQSETQHQSEPQSETQPQTQPQPETQPQTQKPEWPQGQYLVKVTDIAAVIPEGGRIYDGTDKIDITYNTQIVRSSQTGEERNAEDEQKRSGQAQPSDEEIPEYHVTHTAHLESTDAGERKVICSFSLQTPYPEHVKLDETTIHPDLQVTVHKAVLSVKISDGTKLYADPADMDHIHLEDEKPIIVSGFVRDASGQEIIPQGFELPELDVDPSVIEKFSPIYEQAAGALSKVVSIKQYKKAIVMKQDSQGRLTGNPTENYEFCKNPDDPRYECGTVVIKRASAQKDVTYVLKGEKGAYRFDDDGTVILRAGSSLTAEPVQGQGYNTGFRKDNLTGSGTITFRLEKRNKDGLTLADSREISVSYRTDGSAPKAEIQADANANTGGIYFSSSGVTLLVKTSDDEGGSGHTYYRVLSGDVTAEAVQLAMKGRASLSASASWEEIGKNARVSLSREQICTIEVKTEDAVGNTQITRGPLIIIDTGTPQIEIKGAEDKSANASGVRITAQCLDPSYLPSSMKAELTADFGGVIPEQTISEDAGTATVSFEDFPMRKEADAVYHLSVTAKDRAGNTAKKEISFSVNRFGSSYSLSAATASALKQYYHNKPFDVVFCESNLDKVGNARVLLRSGESMTELRPGRELRVDGNRSDQGASQYTYTVTAACFKKDGPYEVMLLTTDRAGNSSDSSAQRLPVRFAIDSTGPECLISGISPKGRYKEEELTAAIETRDNLALNQAEVYLNSRKLGTWSAKELDRSGGVMKLKLKEQEEWQTVQVHATDMAGNETWSKEIPVYISSDDPEKAEDYHAVRLSAQQIDTAVRYVKKVQKVLSGFRLIQNGKFVWPGMKAADLSPAGAAAAALSGAKTGQAVRGSTQAAASDESLDVSAQYTASHKQKSAWVAGNGEQSAGSSTVRRKASYHTGGIIGIIFAVTLGLIALGAAAFYYLKRRKAAVLPGWDDPEDLDWDWVNASFLHHAQKKTQDKISPGPRHDRRRRIQ